MIVVTTMEDQVGVSESVLPESRSNKRKSRHSNSMANGFILLQEDEPMVIPEPKDKKLTEYRDVHSSSPPPVQEGKNELLVFDNESSPPSQTFGRSERLTNKLLDELCSDMGFKESGELDFVELLMKQRAASSTPGVLRLNTTDSYVVSSSKSLKFDANAITSSRVASQCKSISSTSQICSNANYSESSSSSGSPVSKRFHMTPFPIASSSKDKLNGGNTLTPFSQVSQNSKINALKSKCDTTLNVDSAKELLTDSEKLDLLTQEQQKKQSTNDTIFVSSTSDSGKSQPDNNEKTQDELQKTTQKIKPNTICYQADSKFSSLKTSYSSSPSPLYKMQQLNRQLTVQPYSPVDRGYHSSETNSVSSFTSSTSSDLTVLQSNSYSSLPSSVSHTVGSSHNGLLTVASCNNYQYMHNVHSPSLQNLQPNHPFKPPPHQNRSISHQQTPDNLAFQQQKIQQQQQQLQSQNCLTQSSNQLGNTQYRVMPNNNLNPYQGPVYTENNQYPNQQLLTFDNSEGHPLHINEMYQHKHVLNNQSHCIQGKFDNQRSQLPNASISQSQPQFCNGQSQNQILLPNHNIGLEKQVNVNFYNQYIISNNDHQVQQHLYNSEQNANNQRVATNQYGHLPYSKAVNYPVLSPQSYLMKNCPQPQNIPNDDYRHNMNMDSYGISQIKMQTPIQYADHNCNNASMEQIRPTPINCPEQPLHFDNITGPPTLDIHNSITPTYTNLDDPNFVQYPRYSDGQGCNLPDPYSASLSVPEKIQSAASDFTVLTDGPMIVPPDFPEKQLSSKVLPFYPKDKSQPNCVPSGYGTGIPPMSPCNLAAAMQSSQQYSRTPTGTNLNIWSQNEVEPSFAALPPGAYGNPPDLIKRPGMDEGYVPTVHHGQCASNTPHSCSGPNCLECHESRSGNMAELRGLTSQQRFIQNLIADKSNAFRSHPLYPLLRDLIIADMNFHSAHFPFQLISNLPADFDRLLHNFLQRNPPTTTYQGNYAVESVVMDALRYAHSCLIEKIQSRRDEEKPRNSSSKSLSAIEEFCEKFDRAVRNMNGPSHPASAGNPAVGPGVESTPDNCILIPPSSPYGVSPMKRDIDLRPPLFTVGPQYQGYRDGYFANDTVNSYNNISNKAESKKHPSLPKEAVAVMLDWLRSHKDNPYPNDDEKSILIKQTGLSINQINYWFTNARRRILPKWSQLKA